MSAQPAGPCTDELIVEIDGTTMIVTINRPAARNAITQQVADGIAAAVQELDGRQDLRVGIITGAAGTFSAGMDLKGFARGERPHVVGRGFAGIAARPPTKPIIAAVEGYALAGGWEIVLACDLVVASTTAIFGIPEVRRGLVAAAGALLRLPDWTSMPIAMELALTGESITAERARELGLVNRVVPADCALAEACALARVIAANGPLAVVASKRILRTARDWPSDTAFGLQADISEPVLASADAREGARAFAERRPAGWRGE